MRDRRSRKAGDFGRPGRRRGRHHELPPLRLPISTPPYYGGKVTPTLFTTVGGLKVNTDMQVVNEEGQAIEGLYAAGGDANGMYGANYDVDVMSGGQQGWCATSGRLAAEHALS